MEGEDLRNSVGQDSKMLGDFKRWLFSIEHLPCLFISWFRCVNTSLFESFLIIHLIDTFCLFGENITLWFVFFSAICVH